MNLDIKKIMFLCACAGVSSSLFAKGVCFHCEEIRENNRLHPHNYEYYDDYLAEQHKAPIQPETIKTEKAEDSKLD